MELPTEWRKRKRPGSELARHKHLVRNLSEPAHMPGWAEAHIQPVDSLPVDSQPMDSLPAVGHILAADRRIAAPELPDRGSPRTLERQAAHSPAVDILPVGSFAADNRRVDSPEAAADRQPVRIRRFQKFG